MSEGVDFSLPKTLKHWINSIKTPSGRCTLFDDARDLYDGNCIRELVEYIFHCKISANEQTPAGLIQASLNTIGEYIGWKSLPPEFKYTNTAYKLANGEPVFMTAFIQFLHDLSIQRAEGAKLTESDTDVEHILSDMREEINDKVHSHLTHLHNMHDPTEPVEDSWDDSPLTYDDYMQLQMEKDSLQSSGELNVMNSTDFRAKKSKLGNKTPKSAPRGANKPTLSAGINRAKVTHTRYATVPNSAKVNNTGYSTGASDILSSSVHSAPTTLVQRKHSALRNITNTTTNSTNTTNTTHTTKHTTPSHIKVHTTGLHMHTLHDPTYKPKAGNVFAETVVPVVLSSSESSDSDDSLVYDYTNTGTSSSVNGTSSGRRVDSVHRKLPHSRSVSPGGRRHIHNQLHSIQQSIHNTTHNTSSGANNSIPSTHNTVRSAQFGVVNRSISPLEARLSRFYPYQQQYTTNPTDTTTENIPTHNKPRKNKKNPHTVGDNAIKTHQFNAVKAVFNRQPPVTTNIDEVISIERKNTILMWIQRQLNIHIDTHINSTTSNTYNKTAGRNVVNPDTVAVIPHTHSSNTHNSSNMHNKVYTANGNIHSSYTRRDKHSPHTNTTHNNTTHPTTNTTHYTFYPTPEAAQYTAGRSAYMHGTYSIATYLGRVTSSVGDYSANVAVQVHNKLISGGSNGSSNTSGNGSNTTGGTGASDGLLQIPVGYIDDVGYSVPPEVHAPHTSQGLLSDPWVNGTLLSEVLACLSGENRALIKQVDIFDRFGVLLRAPKLVVAGTEHNVRSKAQAIHNIQLCMDFLTANIPLFPSLDYSAEDIVSGQVSLWRLLDVVHELCRGRSRGGGRGSRGRGRSVSPGAGQRNQAPLRSISAPPDSRLQHRHAHTTHTGNSVHFADSGERSRGSAPVPASPPRREQSNISNTSRSSNTNNTNVTRGSVRARSVSPSSVHGNTSNTNIDATAAGKLELRRQEADSERLRAREYARRARLSASGGINGSNNSGTSSTEQAERGWQSSTTVEKPRSGSATTRRGSVTTPTAASTTNTNATGNTTDTNTNVHTNNTHTNNTHNTNTKYSKQWHPPRLSTTEVEAARSTYLPTITIFQMRAIRDWLYNAFSINLYDAECGFGYMGVISDKTGASGSSGDTSGRNATNNNNTTTNTSNVRTDARFDPKYTHPSITTPPPLPIQDDRLRNGVLLGLLLLRLEPVAAIHAHMPVLLHRKPRSIELCIENIERVLFLFKVRRSPPLPHHYLCLSEEILSGNERVVWGLLWELMQAYPYNALSTPHTQAHTITHTTHPKHTNTTSNNDNYTTHTNNGVLYANTDTLIPQPGNGPLKNPPKHTASNNKTHANPTGLKGAEAKHNVPQYMRYNYDDAELEHPVPVHTLPYSDKQRHLLDMSLLQWIDDCGVLSSIIGSLARPVTVLALESYCRDGTLLCTLTTTVLGLVLSKQHTLTPTTYTECMTNIKLCTEVLRKCQNMRSRYLYSGVEEHICGGRWDSILGLLEDMHRYSDGVHPHAHIFSTVDVHGKVAGSSGSGFDVRTVEAPYLGKYGVQGSSNGGNSGSSGGGSTVGRSMSTAHGPDLLHDIPYNYEPQLNIHHDTHPTNTLHTNNTHTHPTYTNSTHSQVNLDNSGHFDLFSPESEIKPSKSQGQDEFIPAVRAGDLFPSNPISGQNVVNLLKQRDNHNNLSNNNNTNNNTNTSTASRVHTSHIPTPIRRSSPVRGTALPAWVVSSPENTSSDALAQMLNLAESDTDTHDARSTHRVSNIQSSGVTSGNNSSNSGSSGTRSGGAINTQHTPVRLRSALKTTSRTPSRTPRTATPRTPYTTGNTSSSANNTSHYSSDSLDGTSSQEASPPAVDVRGNNTPERHRTDPAQMRVLLKWLASLGVHVPTRSERSFANKEVFADGVYLCSIVQKLERCGALPGTFTTPRTQSERVQNIRRCLELLATRHKNIPLRALSCEEDILQGDIHRTIELLFCIKKAYAHHRL